MINSDQGRRVFALQIAGLAQRYFSAPPPNSYSLDSAIATGVNYIDYEAITQVGAAGASIDPSGGIANYGAVSVTLGINRRGGKDDPGVIFGRCGARSTGTRAKLTASATRTDTTLLISTDLTGLSYPRLFHIGGETIRASSAAVNSVLCSRGAANTRPQIHTIGLEGSIVPEITTEITTFRGRRVRLFAAHRYANGNTSQFVEVVNGFIDSSPTIESGESITLSLLPLTALIDTDLSDKGIAQTELLSGYHYYDGRQGSILEYAISLHKDLDNDDVIVTPDTSAAITAATFQTSVLLRRDYESLFSDFDVSLPKGSPVDNYPREHPRYPKLRRSQDSNFSDEGIYPTSLTFDAAIPGYQINADSSATGALNAAEITASDSLRIRLPLVELKQHTLGSEEVKEWPGVINDTLSAAGPSSTAGVNGGFARWRLNSDNIIRVEKLSNSPFQTILHLWNYAVAWRRTTQPGAGWYQGRMPYRWGDFGTTGPLDDLSRLSYPLNIINHNDIVPESFTDVIETGVDWVPIRVESNNTTGVHQLIDVPTAYYQQFESTILVKDSLGLPTSLTAGVFYYITVQYFDHAAGDIARQVFKCTHQTAANFGGSAVGYLIHISNSNDFTLNKSFGDWTDKEKTLIFRGGQVDGDRPGATLLRLLESGGGGQLNGAYDQFSLGLNISSDDIDEASFLAIDAAATFVLTDNFAGDGQNLRDTFNAILQMLGAVLVMQCNPATGLSKIALVPLGNEKSSASSLTINQGDWIADPPPRWGIYEDIVTQIKYEFDFDGSDGQFKNEVIFNNQEAINRYSGERSQITLRIPGLNSRQFGRNAGDYFGFFLPTSSRIFNLLSNPLRTWTGEIGTGKSIYLNVGDYVVVSSPHLRSYSDNYGVNSGVGMIRAIRKNLMSEGCELEILTTGITAINWNSAGRVNAITATEAQLDASKYSDSTAVDASFFKAGDVVDYLPAGNHDSAITGLIISKVNGNIIKFTAPHGITAIGGTIEPTTYAAASSEHKTDAYLSNNSDILSTSTPAQEFS